MAAGVRTEVGGLAFALPTNWTAAVEEAEDGVAAELQSSGVTFGIVASYDPFLPPEGLVDQALQSLGEEHEDLETEPLAEPTWKAGGVGVEAVFMSLDMVSYVWLRGWRIGAGEEARTAFVFVQSIEPEAAAGRAAFEVICRTLEAA